MFKKITSGKQSQFVLFVLLFAALGSLTFNFLNRFDFGFFRTSMYTDRAAYYSYLPYLFEAKGKADQLIQNTSIDELGRPFKIDSAKNAMINKYPVGMAIMQSPFYLMGVAAEKILNIPADNYFNGLRIRFVELGAPFYMVLSFLILYAFLGQFNISPSIRVVAILFLFITSSAYYYTVMEGTMSHAYSFFLLSAFNLLYVQFLNRANSNFQNKLLLALVVSLIILVRPFNAILIIMNGIFLIALSRPHFKDGILKSVKLFPVFLPVFCVLIIPQAIYYQHAFDSFLVYSYGKESFYFDNPQILKSLVNPRAGMLIYTPVYVIFVISLIVAAIKDSRFWMLGAFFILIFYINSCWWSWHFGCGFGLRPYVEWLPILLLPFALLLNEKRNLKWAIPVLVVLVFYNIRMSYVWSGCWFQQPEQLNLFIERFWT